MGRSPCCSKQGLNRGAWTAMEDRLLTSYIQAHGEGRWRNLPHRAGLKRCGKSCRLRWLNYLRPNIKRGNITHDEEDLIIRLHNLLGNRWSLIAGRLPGRTDNEIKNYWNTTLAKKLRPSSPAMPLHNLPSKAKVRPQVIQTKASRCRNVVILQPQYPNLNSPPSNHTKFDEAHLAPQIQSPIQSPASHSSPKPHVHPDPEEEDGFQETHNWDVNLLTCGSNNRFQPNAADLCTDVFNLESSAAMDGHGIDQLMVNGWTTPSGFEVDHNGTMDLDSLVLLLDSGDWP